MALTPTHCHLIDITRLRISKVFDCLDIATDLKRVEYGGDAITVTIDGQLAAVLARGTMLAAAFQVGICVGALNQTLSYVKQREQFGQPIGGFQAIKHRCADMAVQAEVAWSITAQVGCPGRCHAPPCKLVAASAKAVGSRCPF